MPKLLPLVLIHLLIAQGSNADGWVTRGRSEYAVGRYASAVTSFSQAIASDPSDDVAHYMLANSLLKIGQTEAAIHEYQRTMTLSKSPQLRANCQHALDAFNVIHEGPARRRWRESLPAPTSSSVEQLNSLAGSRKNLNSQQLDSSPEGIPVFKEAPESSGEVGVKWNKWIQDFRMAFESVLAQQLGNRRAWLSGKTRMVFSVDATHKLRGRIINSNAPPFFNDSLLAATRRIDGSHGLDFPSGSAIKGFNFMMGWNYGTPYNAQTLAAMQRTNANLMRSPQAVGARATAGRLDSSNTSATLANKQANGTLLSNKGDSAQANGSLMPSFQTNLSGVIMPKPKPVELKAAPAKSLDDVTRKKK